MSEPLPVERVVPQIRALLDRGRSVILHAPPGAGKTTLVPGACLDSAWLNDRRIIMLEPRRVAARAAAARIASLRKEQVGDTIGYRTRADSRVGPRTRIEVVTEGVLTRRIQRDPTLEDVGLLIFDEFHERSLVGDLGLALALQTRSLIRDDLRLMVMSATLDTSAVATLVGDAEIISSEGRVFPIETRYAPPRDDRDLEPATARTTRRALTEHEGDILVFLPGAAEIRRVRELIGDVSADVVSLHGSATPEEQDAAVSPARDGRRRIVLATSIAETSLTIPGVRVVIDAGLARRPRFSPVTGMTRLETTRVSRATADQRRGRAGRTAPGVCYRLWHEHEQLTPAPLPEILEADLAPLALDLAAAGIQDPATLRWIDPPPAAPWKVAQELIRELSLADSEGRLTPAGADAARLPLHPRLARMIGRAVHPDDVADACTLAALLGERDVLISNGQSREPDLGVRLDLVRAHHSARASAVPAGFTVNGQILTRVAREAERLRRMIPPRKATSTTALGASALLAIAYPDRVGLARRGTRGRYLLRAGVEVEIDQASPIAGAEFVVVAELDGRRPLSRAFLAAPLERQEVHSLFGDQLEQEDLLEWDDRTEAIVARRRVRLGAIVFEERDVEPDPIVSAELLARAAVERGLLATEDVRAFLARVRVARGRRSDLPDWSIESLAATVAEWLAPHLIGMRKLDGVARLDLTQILADRLDGRLRKELDRIAPTHLVLPTGTRAAIDYGDPSAPSISARIQELFGLAETPRVGDTPLTIHLLSPANRPVQVTNDLAGFWARSYFDVRKDMRGRYPRHPWPDDPASATPTRRVKPR